MNKYEKIIYWCNEDNCYVVDVPELPGCMAHGSTEIDALNNINDAIELWLEVAKKGNIQSNRNQLYLDHLESKDELKEGKVKFSSDIEILTQELT